MVRGSTKVCMILGYPVKHSRSPLMHNAAFAALGIDYIYIPVEVRPASLESIIKAVRGMENFGGANITVPHKIEVMRHLDGWSDDAKKIGAVNTLYKRGNALWGDNTDGKGFCVSLREEIGFLPKGKRAMILGAGGSARAVAQRLMQEGVSELYLANRTLERAVQLASCLADLTGVQAPQQVKPLDFGHLEFSTILQRCDLLVNATSVGLSANDPPLFDYNSLPSTIIVYDLIYEPPLTPLLKAAQDKGCRVVNGLSMLVHQGAISFEIWIGRLPPLEEMRKAAQRIW